MKIATAIRTGILRAARAWKVLGTAWLISFIMAVIIALPLKAAVKSGLGSSMITERLIDGIDVEVVTDFMNNYNNLSPFFFSGLFILLLAGLIVNAFITGGLFDSVSRRPGQFNIPEFFRSGAANFRSFFGITAIISIMIIFLGLFVLLLPAGIVLASGGTDYSAVITLTVSAIFFFLIIAFLMLVSDYARAWQVSNERKACMKALGFGFRYSFKSFLSSYFLMIFLILIQVLFNLLAIRLLGTWRPVSSGGIFLLLIISQTLFFLRLFLKTVRYASVSYLMEMTDINSDIQSQTNPDII